MFNQYKLILKKELIDILRDKRSFIMIFVPIFVFPLMYYFIGSQLSSGYLEKDIPCIVDCKTDADEDIYDAIFGDTDLIKEMDVDSEDKDDIPGKYYDLKDGLVYAVLNISDGEIELVYNISDTKAITSVTLVSKYLTEYSEALMKASPALSEHDLTYDDLDKLDYSGEATSLTEYLDTGNSFMASIAPMMLVLFIMSGGTAIAVDLFSGEKERGTLESLMTTQVNRVSLMFSKFTAVLFVSLLSMATSILAYVLSFKISPEALAMFTGSSDTTDVAAVSLAQVAQTVCVCFSLAVFAVALMTFIGLNSRSVKEAQSQMGLMTIFPTLLGGVTMFMDSSSISEIAMLIPVFNTIASIKMIFLGTIEPLQILLTSVSCIVYAVLIGNRCIKILNSEKLLK